MKKNLICVDLDDTLFETNARIAVKCDSSIICYLTNQEYNLHILQENHYYDFDEFRSSKKFAEESKPIQMVLKRIIKKINNPLNHVVIITARADFDDKELFLLTLQQYGIDTDKIHVYRAGNTDDNTPVSVKKSQIIQSILNKYKYNKIELFDDAKQNLIEFLNIKTDSVLVAYLINNKKPVIFK